MILEFYTAFLKLGWGKEANMLFFVVLKKFELQSFLGNNFAKYGEAIIGCKMKQTANRKDFQLD